MGTILAFLEPPPVEFTIKARPMRLIYQYRVRADPGGLVWWAAGLAVIAVAGMLSVYAARARLGEYAARLIGLLPGVGRRDAGSSDTASKMTGDILALDRTVATRALLWSLAISLAQATMLFFVTRSVAIDLSYPFMVAVSGVIGLSLLLPLSVNGVGTREAILVTAFSAADRSTDAAVAIGLLMLLLAAIGSSPGLIEWVRRTLAGRGRHLEEPAAVTESGRAP